MREALRQLSDGEYWVYGPSLFEIERAVDLIQKYSDYADLTVQLARDQKDVPLQFQEAHAEVVSDLAYYAWQEKGMLWAFALWRMQGLFEALIVSTYLGGPRKARLSGLRAKLDALSDAGLSLSPDKRDHLLAWAELRNLLSHMPPEQHRSIALDRQDINEFLQLLREAVGELDAQQPNENARA